MNVTPEDLRRIADLAALDLDGDDLDALATDVRHILHLVDALKRADVDVHAEEFRVRGTPLRDDVAVSASPIDPEQLSPHARDGFYVVPRPPGVGRE